MTIRVTFCYERQRDLNVLGCRLAWRRFLADVRDSCEDAEAAEQFIGIAGCLLSELEPLLAEAGKRDGRASHAWNDNRDASRKVGLLTELGSIVHGNVPVSLWSSVPSPRAASGSALQRSTTGEREHKSKSPFGTGRNFLSPFKIASRQVVDGRRHSADSLHESQTLAPPKSPMSSIAALRLPWARSHSSISAVAPVAPIHLLASGGDENPAGTDADEPTHARVDGAPVSAAPGTSGSRSSSIGEAPGRPAPRRRKSSLWSLGTGVSFTGALGAPEDVGSDEDPHADEDATFEDLMSRELRVPTSQRGSDASFQRSPSSASLAGSDSVLPSVEVTFGMQRYIDGAGAVRRRSSAQSVGSLASLLSTGSQARRICIELQLVSEVLQCLRC